jgi:WD40 repeat protein
LIRCEIAVILTIASVIDGDTREHYYDAKAHSGEIMDIAIHNDTIVSCARDRTVQIFEKKDREWGLSQTLDDHTASVQKVLLLEDGNKLLSCSTDRTIVVRELCRREAIDGTITDAYIPVRTLNTKASPIHMAPLSDSASTLLVSTLDRQIIKFDLVTGRVLSSFKVTDETGDAVVMDAITLSEDKGKPRIIVGTSTTDKSVRIYDLNGGLVDKEWGHTEGVSDVCLLEVGGRDLGESVTVISTGTDGTIMIWDFLERVGSNLSQSASNGYTEPSVAAKDTTAARTPLRRVLSKSELVEFIPKGSPSTEFTGSGSKSVGSTSPPRQLRKKASMYGMNRPLTAVTKAGVAIQQQTQTQQVTTPINSTTSTTSSSSSEESASLSTPISTPTASGRQSRKSVRGRTPSPPDPQTRLPAPPRRPSYDARARNASRSRGKSDASVNGAGSMNNLAESLARSLRSFRKKAEAIGRSENNNGVRPEVMRDLQRELALTVKELGRGSKSAERDGGSASSTGDDDMMAMLETYSSKLLSMVNDRLEEQFQRKDGEEVTVKTNGTSPTTTNDVSDEANSELDRRKAGGAEVTGEG